MIERVEYIKRVNKLIGAFEKRGLELDTIDIHDANDGHQAGKLDFRIGYDDLVKLAAMVMPERATP